MKKIFYILIILIIAVYGLFRFVIPFILNKKYCQNKIVYFINKKINYNFNYKDLKISADNKLTYKFNIKQLQLQDLEKNDILNTENIDINYNLILRKIKRINIESIYIDEINLKKFLSKNKSNTNNKFNHILLPETKIKKGEIWINKGKYDSFFIDISDINIYTTDNKTYCNFKSEIISPLLKNTIVIGENGNLIFDDSGIKAQNIKLQIGIESLYINGLLYNNKNQSDFTIIGKNIPIYDIETSILYFQKLKNNEKKFIENFKNFDGYVDINLHIKDKGLYGECIAKGLKFSSVFLNIPFYFKNAVFKFNNDSIKSISKGNIGNENIISTFNLNNLFSDNQEISGKISSNLSNKFANTYIPNLKIENIIKASLDYRIKNKKVYIDYLCELPQNSDLHYKNAYLGLKNDYRKLLVRTTKHKDSLYIDSYNYSIQEGNNYKDIILGNGLLSKIKGHYTLNYLTFKTNDYAPFSVIGALNKYIDGGYFNGDLKYDYLKNKVDGIFEIKDAKYKNFVIQNAGINATNKTIKIIAAGEYNNSDFNCDIDLVNNFDESITINKLNLFLEKLIIKNHHSKKKNKLTNINIQQAAKDFDITVDEWNIKLNELLIRNMDIKNIDLSGNLKNDIFKFIIKNANYANGCIKANGNYNFINNSSDINFEVNNIDSNIVAENIFNLHKQIHGYANAKVFAQTKNKFEDIQADIQFSIEDGYLLKLGSTELIIRKFKRPIKFKVSDMINIDLSKTKSLSSDINGFIHLDNNELKNINLKTKQKYLSMFIEGSYNIENEYANLQLWGKYNKRESKKVKIFFVPLSWIIKILFHTENTKHKFKDKLYNIPEIQGREDDTNNFRIKIEGDINNNNVKVELKSIK